MISFSCRARTSKSCNKAETHTFLMGRILLVLEAMIVVFGLGCQKEVVFMYGEVEVLRVSPLPQLYYHAGVAGDYSVSTGARKEKGLVRTRNSNALWRSWPAQVVVDGGSQRSCRV